MPLIQSGMNTNRVYSDSDICCYRLRCTYVFDGFMNFPENIVYPVDLDGNHHKCHPALDPDSAEQLRIYLFLNKSFHFTTSVRNKYVLSIKHILKHFYCIIMLFSGGFLFLVFNNSVLSDLLLVTMHLSSLPFMLFRCSDVHCCYK